MSQPAPIFEERSLMHSDVPFHTEQNEEAKDETFIEVKHDRNSIQKI